MSRHRNRTTVTKRSASRKIRGNRINNRISINRNGNFIAHSVAQGVQLQSLERVFVRALSRNNRVSQRGSTGNSRGRVEPLILHVRSIPVVQVSCQRDLTANTDVRLSSRDVDDRNCVNINMRLSRGLATVSVHQRNIKVVSIVSVVTRKNDRVFVDTRCTGQRSVVLIPCERVVCRRSRINMSNHRDIVARLLADERVGLDSQCRVRNNRQGVSERNSGFATGSRLLHRNRVGIVRRIIAYSVRSLRVGSINSIRNHFTISVPCVNLTSSNTTAHVSRHRNRTTVTKRSASRKIRGNRINNRISINRNGNFIAHSVAQGVQLQSLERVFVRALSRNNRVSQRGSTGNSRGRVEPLILHVRSIPVVQVSCQRDLTANTDVRLSSRDVDDRNCVNINMRLSRGLATVSVHQRNIKVVSIVSVVTRKNDRVFVDTRCTGQRSVVLVPCERVVCRRSRINMSNHRDVIARLLADERVGFDSQRRVRSNRYRISNLNDRFATGSRLFHRNFIDISGRIIVLSMRSLRVGSLNSIRNHITISVPCVNLTSSNTTAHVSRHRNRTTVTKRSASRKIRGNRINNRISINRNGNFIAHSVAQGVQLQSLERVFVRALSRNNRVSQRGSTGNSRGRVEPLILHVRSIPVVQVSCQRDLTANADVRLGSCDVDDRNRVNINLSLSRGLATVSVHQADAEVISIISVVACKVHCIAMRTCSTSQRSVVLVPCEGVVRGRNRIHMGNHHNIVVRLLTNERIGFDSQGRVRVNRESNRVERDSGFTTRTSLSNRNCIFVNSRIVVLSVNRLREDCGRSIRNNLTVSVPSEDLATSDTAADMSRHRNRTTVTKNHGVRKIRRNRIDNRIINNSNGDIIIRSTDKVLICVIIHQMNNLDIVSSCLLQISDSLMLVRVTQHLMSSIRLILIPLECEHILIVVVQVSVQRDITTLTNQRIRSCDMGFGSFVNIDLEFRAEGRTTITINNL